MSQKNSGLMKKTFYLLALLSLWLISPLSLAAPFTVVVKSGTSLPTIVRQGKVVTAYYTVSNNTSSARANNSALYLPPNVSQIASGGTYPDTCGRRFNLAARGQPGSSCTLELSIYGPVNAQDPNPLNHLYVCLSDGLSCAGTPDPVNITLTLIESIAITPTGLQQITTATSRQFTATATYADGTTGDVSNIVTWNAMSPATPSSASVNSVGLVSGRVLGLTNINATYFGHVGLLTSNPVTVFVQNAVNPLVSIQLLPATANIRLGATQHYVATGTFANATTQNLTTNQVQWASSNMAVATIAEYTGVATGNQVGGVTISAYYGPIPVTTAALNVVNYAYVVNKTGHTVSLCIINNTNGTFSNCVSTGTNFSTPNSIAINAAGTFAYIGDDTLNQVTSCAITSIGTLVNCTINTSMLWSKITSLSVNPANGFLYVATANSALPPPNLPTITYAAVNANGTVATDTVADTLFSGSLDVLSLASYPDGSALFYGIPGTGQAPGVSDTFVQPDGTLAAGGVLTNPIALPYGIALATAIGGSATQSGWVYAVDNSNSTIVQCPLPNPLSAGAASPFICVLTGSGFNAAIQIAINPQNTFAYVANLNSGVSLCAVSATDGSFTCGNSTSAGGAFSGPRALAILSQPV
jgi:hypothetical protein